MVTSGNLSQPFSYLRILRMACSLEFFFGIECLPRLNCPEISPYVACSILFSFVFLPPFVVDALLL